MELVYGSLDRQGRGMAVWLEGCDRGPIDSGRGSLLRGAGFCHFGREKTTAGGEALGHFLRGEWEPGGHPAKTGKENSTEGRGGAPRNGNEILTSSRLMKLQNRGDKDWNPTVMPSTR